MLINYIPNGKVTITVLTGRLINATSLYKKLFSRTTYKKNKLIKTKKRKVGLDLPDYARKSD